MTEVTEVTVIFLKKIFEFEKIIYIKNNFKKSVTSVTRVTGKEQNRSAKDEHEV